MKVDLSRRTLWPMVCVRKFCRLLPRLSAVFAATRVSIQHPVNIACLAFLEQVLKVPKAAGENLNLQNGRGASGTSFSSRHLRVEGKWNRVKRSQERPARPASSRRAFLRAENPAEHLTSGLGSPRTTRDVCVRLRGPAEAAEAALRAQAGKSV